MVLRLWTVLLYRQKLIDSYILQLFVWTGSSQGISSDHCGHSFGRTQEAQLSKGLGEVNDRPDS